jgi:hypothetical protein
MSKKEKLELGQGIALTTLILTMIAMICGGAVKCGEVDQTLVDHGERLNKLEPVAEVVFRLEGKVDSMLEILKAK